MTRTKEHRWLNRFAWLTAATTFVLLGVGGLVTSHEAGMAVPDWPTTYGYNLFLFPFHMWTGGVLYEHSHRLVASWVGFLTTILAVWVWLREPRVWLRWLAVGAFFAVVLQGVLGGLRVTLFKDEIGIFHATLAQVFFVSVTLIALFLSGWDERIRRAAQRWNASYRLRFLSITATVMILLQLVIGAMMRHQHAGLAIPDFPLAYGKLWPPMDEAFVQAVNQSRTDSRDFKPITGFQIGLQMLHRILAAFILAAVGAVACLSRREQGSSSGSSKLALGWLALIFVQAALGALTIWSNKAADVATSHVLVGSLSLLAGAVLNGRLIAATSVGLVRSACAQASSVPDLPLSQPKPSAT